jgi:integrase
VPIDQISALLGHRSVKMTEKHYLPRGEGAAEAANRQRAPRLVSGSETDAKTTRVR